MSARSGSGKREFHASLTARQAGRRQSGDFLRRQKYATREKYMDVNFQQELLQRQQEAIKAAL